MTVNGGSTTRADTTWRAAVPCPRGESSLTSAPGRHTEQNIRELEAAALVRAYSEANAGLAASHPQVGAACDAVVRAYRTAEAAVGRLASFVSIGVAEDARDRLAKVVDRHVDDGPEDRRRVVRWARWMLWPAAFLATVFDGIYLGKVFQQILNVAPGTPVYYLSYVPTVGITIALLVSGTWLAEAVIRHQTRAERRPHRGPLNAWRVLRRLWFWREGTEQRDPQELPWPSWLLPVGFFIAVFLTLGSWARIRAQLAAADNDQLAPYEPYAAAMLVLLSVSVVALKFLAHNPYADSAAEADQLLKRAVTESEPLLADARESVSAHHHAWIQLQTSLAATEAAAKLPVEHAVVAIREERGCTGRIGQFEPPGQPTICGPSGDADDPSDAGTDPALRKLCIDLNALKYGHQVVENFAPAPLSGLLDDAVARLDRQLQGRPTTTDGGTSVGPKEHL